MIRVTEIIDTVERKMDGCGDPNCEICSHFGNQPAGGMGPLAEILRKRDNERPRERQNKDYTDEQQDLAIRLPDSAPDEQQLSDTAERIAKELEQQSETEGIDGKENSDSDSESESESESESDSDGESDDEDEVIFGVINYLAANPSATLAELTEWSRLERETIRKALDIVTKR